MLQAAVKGSRAGRRPSPADEPPGGAIFLLYDSRRRLTYLMLFRVGVGAVVLVGELMGAWAAPFAQALSPFVYHLFALIAATYGLTIVFALWLRRTAQVERLTVVQLGTDLLLTTILVLLTGGAESGFVFMYLLVIVGATTVLLGRGALGATACAL